MATQGPMTEETPFNPISKKGEVRAHIATMLLEEMKQQNIQAMIIRVCRFLRTGCFAKSDLQYGDLST